MKSISTTLVIGKRQGSISEQSVQRTLTRISLPVDLEWKHKKHIVQFVAVCEAYRAILKTEARHRIPSDTDWSAGQ